MVVVPVITQDESWTTKAACGALVEQDPDAMFVQGAAQRDARVVCFACPVRMDCLVESFEQGVAFGVWGGLTERERRAMLRGVEAADLDWRAYLEADEPLQERFAAERPRSLPGATPAATTTAARRSA